jgi:hypothetical protein
MVRKVLRSFTLLLGVGICAQALAMAQATGESQRLEALIGGVLLGLYGMTSKE